MKGRWTRSSSRLKVLGTSFVLSGEGTEFGAPISTRSSSGGWAARRHCQPRKRSVPSGSGISLLAARAPAPHFGRRG
jgi:hypothetical protein